MNHIKITTEPYYTLLHVTKHILRKYLDPKDSNITTGEIMKWEIS
jgi:hypothetical protein